jgi:acetyltransferase-like isoleucine patch superfamily enzyme
MNRLVLYTAGSGSREILVAIRDANRHQPTWEPVAFVDEDEGKIGTIIDGLPVVGPDFDHGPGIHGICGTMDPVVRKRMSEQLIEGRGQTLASIIHHSVLMADDVRHGAGLVLMPGVKVNFDVRFGKGVHVLWNCMLGHGLRVADYGTVLTNVTVLAGCTIGYGASVGSGSVLSPGATVEDGALVGVGTTLLKSVSAGQSVISMPRVVKWKRPAKAIMLSS